MNDALTAKVSDSEVERTIFSMGSLKAPGPDGLNGLFYQKHWKVIKVEVTNAVKCFFVDV